MLTHLLESNFTTVAWKCKTELQNVKHFYKAYKYTFQKTNQQEAKHF